MKQDVPWNKLALEGVVIVSSILLAFSIDAWWDGRKEFAEQQVVLNDLRIELEYNINSIEAIWLERHLINLFESAILLRNIYGLPVDESATDRTHLLIQSNENLDTLLSTYLAAEVVQPLENLNLISSPVSISRAQLIRVWNSPTYGPSLASLDVLFQSGLINRIENQILRAKLAALPTELADLTVEENSLFEFTSEELRSAIETSSDDLVKAALILVPVSRAELSEDEQSSIYSASTRIVPSAELAYALARRIDLSYRVLRQLDLISNQFEEILGIIGDN